MRRPYLTPSRIVRRTRVLRSPLAYWAMVGVLALFTGLVVARSVRTTGSLAAHYGPLRPVVVATHRLDPGAEVAPGDVAVRQVPGSLAPAGSLASADEAVGRTVVVAVFAGAPGDGGPPGRVRVEGRRRPPPARHQGGGGAQRRGAAAARRRRPRRRAGHVRPCLATRRPPAGADPTFPVARGALVVDVGDDSATVAVGPQEAARVAFAVTTGVVTLALAAPISEAPVARRSSTAAPATTR